VARKTFVIDTNVLIHDPDSMKKFKDSDVVIPLVVLEELDSLKRSSEEIGKNARHVMRYIDSLKTLNTGNLTDGVVIDNNIRVKIHVELRPPEKKTFPLPLDRPTNKILLIAFLLKEQGEEVVVVSKDFVTRVKAEAIGLEAEDYENLKFSYENIYKGYRKIEVPKRDIDMFFKDNSVTLDIQDFSPNEYCIMTCAEQSSAV
jgi:PhoH-like ATPase